MLASDQSIACVQSRAVETNIPHVSVRLSQAARAGARIELARRWLMERKAHEPLLVLGAAQGAAADLIRDVATERGAVFGWYRSTLLRLAAELAAPVLAERGLAPAATLAIEALVARVVHRLAQREELGHFQPIADQPGLPRALATTLLELRMHRIEARAVRPELGRLLEMLERELEDAKMADRALVLELAAERARASMPLLLLDVTVQCARERDLVAALCGAEVLAVTPCGDERSLGYLRDALGVQEETVAGAFEGSLARLQEGLFAPRAAEGEQPLGEDVVMMSAPGESRECVEIARRIHREAERGVPFDRMAILLRSPEQYRPHLEEALRRASIPAFFARGSVRPDPAGRALLALLACAAEGLSARRFAEYLSLGEVPDADAGGAPPPPLPETERWVPPDDELVALHVEERDEVPEAPFSESAPVRAGSLRAPRRWEKVLVEAAVIGGRDRWSRRLEGFARELENAQQSLEDPDDPSAQRIARDREDLAALQHYALPLLDELAALPREACWGEWLDRLGALATRALKRPERVLSVLAELAPMASIGPVDLRQVRLVLTPRLATLATRPLERRYGRVFVAPCEAARGASFDVVFLPGIAERVFPRKVIEDAMLRDHEREAASADLPIKDDRVAAERLALRLGVGAAEKRIMLSYPRLDVDGGRPRVPSFYGLEVVRAAAGRLPGFAELAERAERGGAVRVGWPAPPLAQDAIDEAEHDLALLDDLLERGEMGTAHYLLTANPHLARALRFRARRWRKKWTHADGLVDPGPAARAALDAHRLSARSFSPTALQNFATCPYKFLLYTVYKLAPREVPEAIEELDPLSRGSLVHEVQFELLAELRDEGMLPLGAQNIDAALERLERALARVAERYREKLAPAIERIWLDAIASIRADLREWLRRTSEEQAWQPWRFELAFGLQEHGEGRDPESRVDPVPLDIGLSVRGSIDLVERKGARALRATDHKTGKVRAQPGAVVAGGETLQPVLYALALEKMFPDMIVEEGRLYYCTSTGDFTERRFPLDERARRAAELVVKTVGAAIDQGFLPAAPKEGACRYCDYRRVCGPWEEHRVANFKSTGRLADLVKLRSMT